MFANLRCIFGLWISELVACLAETAWLWKGAENGLSYVLSMHTFVHWLRQELFMTVRPILQVQFLGFAIWIFMVFICVSLTTQISETLQGKWLGMPLVWGFLSKCVWNYFDILWKYYLLICVFGQRIVVKVGDFNFFFDLNSMSFVASKIGENKIEQFLRSQRFSFLFWSAQHVLLAD